MNRVENLNDDEESLRLMMDGRQVSMWTALPGIIQSIDFTKMTCEVQPAIQAQVQDQNGELTFMNLPLLVDVPVVFPSGGGFTLTLPLSANDEVLIVIASRCIDAWWQSGGIQQPVEIRMHDLSDGFAIPGPKSVPNVLPSISSSKAVLRSNDGTVYLSIGSKFSMTNPLTSLNTILNGLVTDLTTFATGLTPATLVAKSAALVTALAAITLEIGELLE